MLTVIGLGSAGCNIAEMFEESSDFRVKLIDSEIEGENCFSLQKHNSPEEYEKNIPDMTEFLKDCSDDVLFIVGGSGKVSGACLKILSFIKNKKINVLYIRPDRELISNLGQLQDRLTFNVLQEYTRSGIFNKIYLVNNINIENILGDMPVIGYNENINKIIYNAIINIFSLEQKNAIINNSTSPKDISRITTIGIYDLDSDTENMFYNFDFIDDKCYYFVINENLLKTDGKLFRNIKDKMKQKMSDGTKISYKIYSTSTEISYCYVVNYSRKIQE